MAAVTETWNPSAPAGGDALSAGDDSIRSFKVAVQERMRSGGHDWRTSSGADQTEGLHCCGVNNAAGGSESNHEFRIYDTDKTTTLVSFRGASFASTPSEVFAGANTIRTTGIVKAATFNATALIKPDTDAAVDLGVTGTNRFRALFLSGAAEIGGGATVTGGLSVVSGTIALTSRSTSSINIVTTGTLTITTADTVRHVIGNLTGNVIVNLPAASSSTGREFFISINTGSNTITISPAGSDKIDSGASSVVLQRVAGSYNGIHIISDGIANWSVVGGAFRNT